MSSLPWFLIILSFKPTEAHPPRVHVRQRHKPLSRNWILDGKMILFFLLSKIPVASRFHDETWTRFVLLAWVRGTTSVLKKRMGIDVFHSACVSHFWGKIIHRLLRFFREAVLRRKPSLLFFSSFFWSGLKFCSVVGDGFLLENADERGKSKECQVRICLPRERDLRYGRKKKKENNME